MVQHLFVDAKSVGVVRFRATAPRQLTVSVECTETKVWLMLLTKEAYAGYLDGSVKPPSLADLLLQLGLKDVPQSPSLQDLLAPDLLRKLPNLRHPGIMESSLPTHTFAANIDISGQNGWWYLLAGNTSDQIVSVAYDVWAR